MQQPRWGRLLAASVLGVTVASGVFASEPAEVSPPSNPAPPVIRSLPWLLGADLAEAASLEAPAESGVQEEGWEDLKSGLRTRNGTTLELGGRTEFGWHDPHDQNGTFYLYWVQLDMGARLTEDISFQSTLSFEPSLDNAAVTPFGATAGTSGTTFQGDKLDVDEAYFQFDNALHHFGLPDPTHTFIVAGLKHHPQVGGFVGHLDKRRQPLVTPTPTVTQFFRDEDLGLWIGSHPFGWTEDIPVVGDLITVVSYTNGNELGLRGAGLAPNNSFFGSNDPIRTLILADREVDFDHNDTEELGAFVALPVHLDELANADGLGTMTWTAFYRDSKIGSQEVANLAFGLPPAVIPPVFKLDRKRAGTSLEWNAGSDGNCHLLFEYVNAVDSNLGRDSFTFETSYGIPLPGVEYRGHKFFRTLEPVFRFSQLNTNLGGAFGAMVSAAQLLGLRTNFLADQQITSVGMNTSITDNTELVIQYNFFNERGISGSELDNDELILAFRARV